MTKTLSDAEKKFVQSEEVTWLSTTTFSTENKELGHKIVDILLGHIVEKCERIVMHKTEAMTTDCGSGYSRHAAPHVGFALTFVLCES